MLHKTPPAVRLVDDDPTVLESQSFFLQLCGWETKTYESAADFLANDDLERCGCLILDVRMPGMTGLELQDEINKRGIDLPIIFLSAHGDIEMAIQCMQKGAFNFLVKPPEPEKLRTIVENAIKKNQTDRRQKEYVEELTRVFNTLTKTEKQIAYLVAKGLTNAAIADLQEISERTVQTHRSSVYEKLDVENAVELSEFLRDMNAS